MYYPCHNRNAGWAHDDVIKRKQTFSALLAICAGNVFFNLRLSKRLSKQSWYWWFESLSWSLWRHYYVISVSKIRGRPQTKCLPRHNTDKFNDVPLAKYNQQESAIMESQKYRFSKWQENGITRITLGKMALINLPEFNRNSSSITVTWKCCVPYLNLTANPFGYMIF